jgi:hypothetical protein
MTRKSTARLGPDSATANDDHGEPGGAADQRSRLLVSKTIVNLAVDAMLLSLAVLLLFIAAVLRFVFPAPSMSGGWTLWGFGYDAWSNFQFALVAVIGLAILLHVMLHWSWVCGVVVTKLLGRSGRGARLDDGVQTLWGVGMLIVMINIVGLLVGLAYLTVQGPGG